MSKERTNSIDLRIKNLNQEATNLKTSQSTGWDSIRSYKIETTNEFDYAYTPTFVSGQTGETMHVYLKFIADHQEAPFAKAVMKIKVAGASWYRIGHWADDVADVKDYGIDTNGWVQDNYGNYSPTETPNKRNELSWYNAISFSGQIPIQVKFIIYATDTGRMIAGVNNNDSPGFSPEIIIQ
jgi:hypothetical protein